MSRIVYASLFALSLCFVSLSVGCGSSKNTVIEDTRPAAEIDKEMEDYEKEMEDTAAQDVKE